MRVVWRCGLAVMALALAGSAQKQIRVLLVSGSGAGERAAAAPLADALRGAGPFSVFATDDAGLITPGTLGRYDVVAMDCDGAKLDAGVERAIERFVKQGKGLALVRAGDCSVMAGAKPAGQAGAAENRILRVRPVEGREFQTVDDTGVAMEPPAGAKVLAVMRPETGREQPLTWTAAWGKGRVYQTRFGRNLAVRRESEFLNSFVGGVEWAATGAVTPPPPPAKKKEVRALVVTGGHTYDPTFYTLFEGQPGITAIVDPHPMPYRHGDFRKEYDVLVLYDSMQVITGVEQKNLTDFIESGKGLVILHHALVDYSDFSWYWQDIMGSRWLKVGGPGSRWKTTWKHGVEMLVYPVGEHPVTAGVGPIRIWDETYKGMWFSPGIKVLMRTDEPTSDGPLVWLSPYNKARVVNIQMGHDRTSHLHPGYRKLVANAIRWSAALD